MKARLPQGYANKGASNMNSMVKQAQKMQEDIQAVQERMEQTEFTEKNIKGTLVGLYCPSYMGELNSVGWHFHFISDDKKKGGHILELNLKDGTAYLDKTDTFTMMLHNDKKFHDINLAKDMAEDIRSAEQDTKGKMQK